MSRKERHAKAEEERKQLAVHYCQILQREFAVDLNIEKATRRTLVEFSREARKHPDKKSQYEKAVIIASNAIRTTFENVLKEKSNNDSDHANDNRNN